LDRRKLKALQVVGRIRKHELDNEASRLGELRGRMSALETRKASLEESLRREGVMNGVVEYAPFIGPFIRSVRAEIMRTERDMKALQDDVEAQEKVVTQKFTEKKTVDIVAQGEADGLARHAKRKAAAAQDDLTIMRRRAYRPGEGL
jgi:hypothetical protein